MANRKFKWKDLPGLFKETYKEWNADEPWRQSAVVAYYAIFSMPALLIIVITIAGSIFGEAAVQGRLSEEISEMISPSAAEEVETMVSNAYQNQNSTIATIIGIAVLLFGATGVFYQLQQSLNNVWGVEANDDAGIKKLLKDRVTSFSVILVIGFLMLISLMLTTMLSVLSDFILENLPDYLLYVFYVVQFIISFGVITLLFGMIYKILPDVELEWRTVWIGAIVTAALFVIGKFALGIYFGRADPGSAYGAAGSVILILLWVSYSCLILFFGAEFTKVYARRYVHKVEPSKHAKEKEGNKGIRKQLFGDRGAARSDDDKNVDGKSKAQRSGPEIIRVQRRPKRSF